MMRTASALLVGAITAVTFCEEGRTQEVGRKGASAGAGVTTPSAVGSDDERAIRETIDAFAKAFQQGDAKAISGLFNEDGEAVDADGNAIQGRRASRSTTPRGSRGARR